MEVFETLEDYVVFLVGAALELFHNDVM